jgi:gamma-glutamylcyclotransferase (GGCT)/AIG2-like uncharacterized protein YtfP
MNLFTYGTLMDAAVWHGVALETCRTGRAVLHGYEVRRLRGQTFPGLIEAAGSHAAGLLYYDVSAEAMERLDEYEGDLYIRVEAAVETEDGTTVPGQVYLIDPQRREAVLKERWHPPGRNNGKTD